MEELRRQAGWAKTFGLPLELVSARRAQSSSRPCPTDGVLGAAFLPTDGYIDPSQLTLALAEGARRGGAEISRRHVSRQSTSRSGRVTGVETDSGSIETDVVVNAGGMFAGEIGRLAGVTVPVVPMAHEYLITKPHGVRLDCRPCAIPRCSCTSGVSPVGSSWVATSASPAPWGLDGIPPDFNGRLLDEDWDRFEELMENAVVRVPELADAEVVRLVNGPEAFTPDGEFILGPTAVRGFWVAAGFCAHGLAGAGGMGKLVAEWLVEGIPSLDVWEMDSRRFGAQYANLDYTLARTVEVYSTYYDVKYPGHERQAGRPLKLSPTYERLRSSAPPSARSRAGSARTGSSRTPAAGDDALRPRGWAGGCGRPAIGAEHRACREAAALFDETSFAKIEVSGEGGRGSSSACARTVCPRVGQITYTSMLNARGGIECDFTVTRLGGGSLPHRHGHGLRPARPRLDPSTRPTMAPSPSRT